MSKDKADLGIEDIINPDFPEIVKPAQEDQQEQAKQVTVSDPISINSEYEALYQQAKWKELIELSQKNTDANDADVEARLYWILANLEAKALPDELLAIGLENIDADYWPELSRDLQKELKPVYAGALVKVAAKLEQQKPSLSFRLYQVHYSLTANSEDFEVFLKARLKELSQDADEAAEGDPIFAEIEELLVWAHKFKLSKPEAKVKSKKQFRYIFLLLLVLAFGLWYFMGYFKEPEETVIALTTTTPGTTKPLPDILPELPEPELELLPLDEGFELSDIINELENKPSFPKLDSNSSKKEQVVAKPSVLDLSGPIEPEELKQVLEGGTRTVSKRPQPTSRSPYIVSGQSKANPIVEGQAHPGFDRFSKVKIRKQGSLYIQPDLLEAELMILYPGDRVEVLRDQGKWLEVRPSNGPVGYILRDTLGE